MGCGASKLDELEAVALCRQRSGLLADAIRFRYALADSTAAYARCLRTAGGSLYEFLAALPAAAGPPSPLLPLPAHRKGDPPAAAAGGSGGGAPAVSHRSSGGGANQRKSHSHSHSGSHIHFSDEDSDEDDEEDSHIHSTDSSPVHFHHTEPQVTYNFARSQPAPAAVSVEHRPEPAAVHYARSTAAPTAAFERRPPAAYARSTPAPPAVYERSYGGGVGGSPPPYYYNDPYSAEASSSNPTSNYNPYPYSYPEQTSNYSANYSAAYGGGGFFGGPASPPPSIPPAAVAARTPPPPPSPPKTSTWDFLNPFGAYESYAEEARYPYTPSRSSKEVREEEGIPDLEDEEHEVVKEAYGDRGKFSGSTSAVDTPDYTPKRKAVGKGEGTSKDGEHLHYESSVTEEASSSSPEVEVRVVDKGVVANEIKQPEPQPQQQQRQQQSVGAVAAPTRYNDLSEVVQEIKTQFERASGSFVEVSKMLEVGKIPYNQKSSVIEVSTRIMCGLPSPSNSKDQFLEFEEENVMGSGNLSSTLRKLYLWEQKLYDEVKVEEKMRIVLERECEHLRRLDERGAEAHKLESTQIFIRKLSTKIRIAIKVVESISNKINKLRDEELWPQINEFIQGMMRMWRAMLECHRIQCQAISDASIASGGRLNDAHIGATKKLELELLDLITCFSAWVGAQKTFVKALNDWLLKGLRYDVPEVTDDGPVPFSPGRFGAPPVFVICNYWSQTINRISETEAVDAMKAFASNVLGLWEQHNFEQRQRLMANRDMDKTLRVVEMEEQQMRRAVEAQNKKLELVSGHSGLALSGQAHHDHTVELSTLHSNLRQFFEAMENFTATSLKAYEELHLRSEEEKLAGGSSRAP